LYDNEHSTLATLDRAARIITELSVYDAAFRGFDEQLDSARAVVAELGTATRDFGASLEFSPGRIDEIETRLAEISRLKRKYGDSLDAVLDHLRVSEERLANIETAEFHAEELEKQLSQKADEYRKQAARLHERRAEAAKNFEKQVVNDLRSVALE